MKISKYINLLLLLSLLIITGFTSAVFAQAEVENVSLLRGKFWITCLPNGSLEKNMNTRYTWQTNYPGHYYANNEVTGGWDQTRIFNAAQITGEDIGWAYRNRATKQHVTAKVQTKHVMNFNLVDPTEPEEYIEGVLESPQKDRFGTRHMAYELEAKTMVWGLPKYDDFVIIKCKLTNTDDVTFNNFYYSRTVAPSGPSTRSHSYETEYLWDNQVSDDIGFIFYDDTSWPPATKGDSSIYDISPGDITGDRGNPGNIENEGSRDRKLYSPFLYAFSFLQEGLTPNKFGEKKVWRNILSTSGDAPSEERYPGHTVLESWSELDNLIHQEQPQMSWRDAHAVYTDGALAGSLWERSARYLYTIGPYDIAPGESIEWIEIFLAGQMDRNVSIMGDTTATLHFVEKGLENLKDNYASAIELISNNYAVPGNIPPPTPGGIPMMGYANEITVEPGSGLVNGNEKSGVNITFDAVHVGYSDPLTGTNDFSAYKIYQSNNDIEGPWELKATIPVSEADKLLAGGKITYFLPADISIPFRYAVSSTDADGNESALSAYSADPVTATAFPSNQMSQIRVVPNPFRQESGFASIDERKRIAFINVPDECTIKIYTVALDLVKTIEHSGGGEDTWGTSTGQGSDYLQTDFAMNVSPGIYIYHIESHVPGHEGDSKIGKIFIIK